MPSTPRDSLAGSADPRPRIFRDIVVYPTQELLGRPSGAFFRGGPDWPRFYTRLRVRQCWYFIPTPVDRRPHRGQAVDETAESGVWCGPLSLHFGHMLADFGMRIAASAQLDPAIPLVFSLWDLPGLRPMSFVWEILDHFGVPPERVRIVSRPTRFETLYVFPQGERLYGHRPSPRHLALLDRISGPHPPPDLDHVYVSRARQPKGRFAGEACLDRFLAAAGVTVFPPEDVPLRQQLALYRRARHLIFSEGSALHVLQLLGHLDADVTVLARRPWHRMAAGSVQPRVRALRYLRAIRGFLCGLYPSGRPQPAAGLTVLDEARCLAGFARLGIDLPAHWDARAYEEARDADIRAWLSRRLEAPTHPRETATLRRQLARLKLDGLAPAATEAGALAHRA